MARKKRGSSSGDGGANDWLNTYADMVTLLMCFFVLLYSMSTVDSEKWALIVQAFNKDAIVEEESVTTQVGTDEIDTSGDQLMTNEPAFDNLFIQLKKYVDENNLSDSIDVSKGDGYTFIMFRNNIFFDGDSSILKPEGETIIKFLANGISEVHKEIAEIRVLGHTSQGSPTVPNNTYTDRDLSSSRAVAVGVHLQENSIIAPKKIVTSGYGQWYAISPFDTPENRAKNRRVEILITQNEAVDIRIEEVYDDLEYNHSIVD